MFANREDAALKLAAKLATRRMRAPLVLGIPRGGVVIAAVLARELDADLDVVLSRKLRAPGHPELALGAVAESGQMFLNAYPAEWQDALDEYLQQECHAQWAEIARRQKAYRQVQPQAPVADRTVIVTDDGIATGSTMIAALKVLREQNPYEVIVAVPVASPDRLEEVSRWCDEVVCLETPAGFHAISQFYEDFSQVDDEEVVALLRHGWPDGVPVR